MFNQHPRTPMAASVGDGRGDRPGFCSFKTSEPIVYPCRWHRDILIQATLENSISSIEPSGPEYRNEHLFGIIVVRRGERRLILAVRDGFQPDGTSALPDHFLMTRSHALSEPRCSTARTIWATRRLMVPIGDRLRILHGLKEAEAGLTLGEHAGLVRNSEAEPAAIVLALVCAGQLDVEFGTGLSPETTVRRRTP